jgi:hypothetical protein
MIRDSIPVGVRDFLFASLVQNAPGAHLDSCKMDTVDLSRVSSGWGVALTTHFHQAPRLWMSGVILYFLLCACVTCHGVTFTFCVYLYNMWLNLLLRSSSEKEVLEGNKIHKTKKKFSLLLKYIDFSTKFILNVLFRTWNMQADVRFI